MTAMLSLAKIGEFWTIASDIIYDDPATGGWSSYQRTTTQNRADPAGACSENWGVLYFCEPLGEAEAEADSPRTTAG